MSAYKIDIEKSGLVYFLVCLWRTLVTVCIVFIPHYATLNNNDEEYFRGLDNLQLFVYSVLTRNVQHVQLRNTMYAVCLHSTLKRWALYAVSSIPHSPLMFTISLHWVWRHIFEVTSGKTQSTGISWSHSEHERGALWDWFD